MLPSNTKRIQERLENWWEFGDQGRPLVVAKAVDPEADIPDTDDLERFWTDPDVILPRKMAQIEHTRLCCEALPMYRHDFASVGMAAALGCPVQYVDKTTIWCDPYLERIEEVAEIELDPDQWVYRLLLDLTRRATERAKDSHYVSVWALEGMTDIVGALYGVENLMRDMLLKPDEVKRAMERVKQIWLRAFADTQGIISRSGNRGYIGWAGIWAPGTTFPMQEDVAYNISPAMFEEFLIPHIRDEVDAMDCPFFHLDGVGMIPHLDSLLAIEKLKVVQWQPGAGKTALAPWHDLVKRILDAGKSVQVFARPEEIDPLVEAVGTRGVLAVVPDATVEECEWLAERYDEA